MLVPLDLYTLVQKLGRLTPSLVLGWRVGGYVREMFDGLDEVRLAVCAKGGFLEGLRITRTENRFSLDVVEAAENETWHARAWHAGTGTLPEFSFCAEQVAMDAEGAASRRAAPRARGYTPPGIVSTKRYLPKTAFTSPSRLRASPQSWFL